MPDILLTGGIVAAGFVALILGWIIHPWTVGGFTRWVESPMQQFMARVGTSVVSAFAMVYFGGMMLAIAFPHWSFAKSFDKEGKSNSVSSPSSGSTSSDDPFAEPQNMTPVMTKPLPPPIIQTEQPAVVPPTQQQVVPSVTPKKIFREIAITHSDPEVAETTKEKNPARSNEDSIKATTDSLQMKVAELKGELAALDAKIQGERECWQEGVNVINRLTNFKKTPVREGSPQYHQCMAASRVIKEVESGATGLKAEKARLEAMIISLEGK